MEPTIFAVVYASTTPAREVLSGLASIQGSSPVTAQTQSQRDAASKSRLNSDHVAALAKFPALSVTVRSWLMWPTSLSTPVSTGLRNTRLLRCSTARPRLSIRSGWLAPQYTRPDRPTMSTKLASRDHRLSVAPMKNTADTPRATNHMVDSALESTKNQEHRITLAPQVRCTWKVRIADRAGPPGKVADQ